MDGVGAVDMAAPSPPAAGPLAGKRIGLLTAWASRSGGGVAEAVVQQAALIAAAGGLPQVFALAEPFAETDRARFGAVPVRHLPVRGPARIGYAPRLIEALEAADLDLLHLHGIWMYPSRAGARWAARTGRPYLVSPHGMLDPWIVGRGRVKKALARWGYERDSWARAAALHALTDDEAADIARETGRADSIVVPNAAPPAGPPRAIGSPSFVYLGRIHPKKNIAALIAAWTSMDRGSATLTIAGWGEPAHVREVVVAAQKAGHSVTFIGAVQGAAKQAMLAQARWLVLPSLSEGLPMVVLEAWAGGTPTMMTAACHLPEGFATGAAAPCGTGVAAIAAGLTTTLAESDARWHTRSTAALALAGGSFSAAVIADRWMVAYAELLR